MKESKSEISNFCSAIGLESFRESTIKDCIVITIRPFFVDEVINKLGLGEFSSRIYDDTRKLAVQEYARKRLTKKEYFGFMKRGDSKATKIAAALLFLADKHQHADSKVLHSLTHGKLKIFTLGGKR